MKDIIAQTNIDQNNNVSQVKTPKPLNFHFYQKNNEKDDNYFEVLKSTNPVLTFYLHKGCIACNNVHGWFKSQYDAEKHQSHLNVEYVTTQDIANNQFDTSDEMCPISVFNGHEHENIICKEGLHRCLIDLNLPSLLEETNESVSRVIQIALNNRFLKILKEAKIKQESELQKIYRESFEKKQFQSTASSSSYNSKKSKDEKNHKMLFPPELIGAQMGMGKTFLVTNAANHNPTIEEMDVIVQLSLLKQWYDHIVSYPHHHEGHCCLYRVQGYDCVIKNITENPKYLKNKIVFIDEAHFLSSSTDRKMILIDALMDCQYYALITGSAIHSGPQNVIGLCLLLCIDYFQLVEQDLEYRKRHPDTPLINEELSLKSLKREKCIKYNKLSSKPNERVPDHIGNIFDEMEIQEDKQERVFIPKQKQQQQKKEKKKSQQWWKKSSEQQEPEEELEENEVEEEEEEEYIPSSYFFVLLLKELKGRTYCQDPYQEAKERKQLQDEQIELLKQQQKTEEFIEKIKRKFLKENKREGEFPEVGTEECPVEMTLSALFMYLKYQHQNVTIAGHKFEINKTNCCETSSQMLCQTYDTSGFSSKRFAFDKYTRGITNGTISRESLDFLTKFDFTIAHPRITSPKLYRVALDMLSEERKPFVVYGQFLENGLYALYEFVKRIENERKTGQVMDNEILNQFFIDLKKELESQDQYESEKSNRQVRLKQPKISQENADKIRSKQKRKYHLDINKIKKIKDKLRFAIFEGNVDPQTRDELRQMINHGQLDCMGITKAGQAGVDINGAAGIMTTSPAESYKMQNQTDARVIRRNSLHKKVFVKHYFSCFPKKNSVFDPEDILELQQLWNLEKMDPNAEDVRLRVIPEMLAMIEGRKTFEERRIERNERNYKIILPFILTVEAAMNGAPNTVKSLWNSVTKQPPEFQLELDETDANDKLSLLIKKQNPSRKRSSHPEDENTDDHEHVKKKKKTKSSKEDQEETVQESNDTKHNQHKEKSHKRKLMNDDEDNNTSTQKKQKVVSSEKTVAKKIVPNHQTIKTVPNTMTSNPPDSTLI
jgi:hypothetical protein